MEAAMDASGSTIEALRHHPQAVLAPGAARATARTAFREKQLGIWRATSWRDYGERARVDGLGLVRLGLQRGEVVSILAETMPEWLYADMGIMGAGGVSNGIYPTDCRQAGRVHPERQRLALPVRRERRAARQVSRGARALPADRARSSSSTWKGWPTSATRRCMPFDELLALGRALRRRRIRSLWDELVDGSKARRAGAAGLHLRHHRPAQGRDAVATATSSSSSRNADAFIPLRHGRRAAGLPAALPHRRAHLHRLPAAALRRHRQFRREPRDSAGEHARGRADASSSRCRASGNASIPASPSA